MTQHLPDWDTFEAALAGVLLRLQHREHVSVGAKFDAGRYVQALRSGPILTVECSGPSADGGPGELSTDEQLALLNLGWPPVDDDGFPNYRTYWLSEQGGDLGWQSAAGAREAAALMCRSLSILGVPGPDGVTLARETFTDPNPSAMPTAADIVEVAEAIADRLRRQGSVRGDHAGRQPG